MQFESQDSADIILIFWDDLILNLSEKTKQICKYRSFMKVFVISWSGVHENAQLIAMKCLEKYSDVSIVYSDPNEELRLRSHFQSVKRPNDLFWEDKFKACLDLSGNDGFLVIHGDCQCSNWGALLERCFYVSESVKGLGVWAPQIDGTYFDIKVSGMISINNTQLVLSALTDGIVFYISPEIAERMKEIEYGKNKFGWGIDLLFCSAAHIANKLVVIDTAIKVFHPVSKRGYDGGLAKRLESEFMAQFSVRERMQCQLLTSYVHYNHARLRRS